MIYLIMRALSQEDLEFISSCGIPYKFLSILHREDSFTNQYSNQYSRAVFVTSCNSQVTLLQLRFGNRLLDENAVIKIYNLTQDEIIKGVLGETKEFS